MQSFSTQLRTILIWALVSLGPTVAADDLPDPSAPGLSVSERYDALVARTAIERSALRTLEADFEQLKKSRFLLTPEESSGTFSYRAPDRVRWHFTAPTEVITILNGGEMSTWHSGQSGSERVEVGRQGEHILELLGPGASLEALQRYFSVQATFPKDPEEPYRLQLDPRIPRIERRIRSMTIHLDPELFVPIYMRLDEPSGDTTELRFAAVKINGEVPDSRFELESESASEDGADDGPQGAGEER